MFGANLSILIGITSRTFGGFGGISESASFVRYRAVLHIQEHVWWGGNDVDSDVEERKTPEASCQLKEVRMLL